MSTSTTEWRNLVDLIGMSFRDDDDGARVYLSQLCSLIEESQQQWQRCPVCNEAGQRWNGFTFVTCLICTGKLIIGTKTGKPPA